MMEIVLSWTVFALVLLSLWHLVWESILAPSFRLEERLELFQVRDEVRKGMIEDSTEMDFDLRIPVTKAQKAQITEASALMGSDMATWARPILVLAAEEIIAKNRRTRGRSKK